MLERVKPGDLCIFSNGEQARVIRVDMTRGGNYDLSFNIPVYGTTEGERDCNWTYKPDGTLAYLTGNTCIHIVKIIAE